GIASRIQWLEAGQDMPAVYNALDLACSSSTFGEGFSNALAEAMACGVPCAATPAGDAVQLIGPTGVVAGSSCPSDLAAACAAVLARLPTERDALSRAARDRILQHFTVADLVQE